MVAGAAGLDAPVRWVHSTEVHDVARPLRGGGLLLMAGIVFPDDDEGLRRFADELTDVPVRKVIFEITQLVHSRIVDAQLEEWQRPLNCTQPAPNCRSKGRRRLRSYDGWPSRPVDL